MLNFKRFVLFFLLLILTGISLCSVITSLRYQGIYFGKYLYKITLFHFSDIIIFNNNILTVYLVICSLHDNCWYIESSDNVRRCWSKHKSDWNNGNRTCRLAAHGQDAQHPADPQLQYLTVLPIDFPERKKKTCYSVWCGGRKMWGYIELASIKGLILQQLAEEEKSSPALSPNSKNFVFKSKVNM
jgi:hypothetical protein